MTGQACLLKFLDGSEKEIIIPDASMQIRYVSKDRDTNFLLIEVVMRNNGPFYIYNEATSNEPR